MSLISEQSGTKSRRYVDSVESLAQILFNFHRENRRIPRLLVALAGAPGAGKSTLSEELVVQLNTLLTPSAEEAIAIPMDGYHLDNAILKEHGTLSVKGAPQTFDVDGFTSLVRRLLGPTADTREVYIPVFDRSTDLSRNAAQAVQVHHSIAIIEGNYLLLQRSPWNELKPLFHHCIMLDVPFDTLERRLIQRWLDQGLDHDRACARARSNDLPNARVVLEESMEAHLYYKSVRQ